MCGLKRENIDFYKKAISSILNQKFDGFHVVLSMYKNTLYCKRELAKEFGSKLSYVYYDIKYPLGVNSTFNKTVDLCVKNMGKFEGYLYVDSGVTFEDMGPGNSEDIIQKSYDAFKSGPYAMASIQVNDDSQIFSHEMYEAFNNKILPDVFAAYCSESVLSFLSSCIQKKWIIIKDVNIKHMPSIEGASVAFNHSSPRFKNSWNNLLCNRNALDFINDPTAIESGLGYEECGNIMMHKKEAYNEESYPVDPNSLRNNIRKYFFLSDKELSYGKIECSSIFNKNRS